MRIHCARIGLPSAAARWFTRALGLEGHELIRGISLALVALFAMVAEVRAEQTSVEAAAKAAGLAVTAGTATVNGVTLYYRDIGPRAETVLLLHGFPETGDAFASVVGALGKRYRLVIPDLRGAGMSQRTQSGYEKKTVATDVKALLDRLGIRRAHVIGHDLGARVAYAFAVQYPERLRSLTVAEAFIEGLAGTSAFKLAAPLNARTRHFAAFARVDESLSAYAGREEELVLSFMNSRSKAKKFTGAEVRHYTASLKRDGGLRAAFMGYEAFGRDEIFAAGADASPLAKTPALAIACQSPIGNTLQRQLNAAGLKNVRGVVLEGCTHWIYEENPEETVPVLLEFLNTAGIPQ